MKTFREISINFIFVGLVFVSYGMLTTNSTLGQSKLEECVAIYQKFLANRTGPEAEKFQTAISTGKEYLKKCKDLPNQEEVAKYVEKQIPRIEGRVYGEPFEPLTFNKIPTPVHNAGNKLFENSKYSVFNLVKVAL